VLSLNSFPDLVLVGLRRFEKPVDLGGGEFAPSVGLDTPEIQCPGDVGQRGQSGPFHRFLNDPKEFPVPVFGQFLPCRNRFGNRFLVSGISQFLPPSFGRLESRLCPGGNQISLVFGHSDQDVDQEWGGVGIVRRHKVHLGVLESGDEVKIAAASVQFGDQEGVTGFTFLSQAV